MIDETIAVTVGDPPPCLGDDCILGFSMEYKVVVATSVLNTKGTNCPQLKLSDGKQAIEDWLATMQGLVKALKPKKECCAGTECDECEIPWKWTKWTRKNFDDLVFTRGLCEYSVKGSALIRVGRREGMCSFPENIV